MPHLTSTAGRHAADLARRRALLAVSESGQHQARERLAARLRAHGLVAFADITPRPNVEPSISANCRLDNASNDETFVFALLDELGWRIAYGRHRAYGHFLTLEHTASGAELLLIVKLPYAEIPRPEAA